MGITGPSPDRASTSHGPSGSGSGSPNVGIAAGWAVAEKGSPSRWQPITYSPPTSGERSTSSRPAPAGPRQVPWTSRLPSGPHECSSSTGFGARSAIVTFP